MKLADMDKNGTIEKLSFECWMKRGAEVARKERRLSIGLKKKNLKHTEYAEEYLGTELSEVLDKALVLKATLV
ncbi:MAG: hypothetical protein R2784_12035 [Saprospiraceae bacterium]